jgi:hypothetical protein
MLRSQHHQQLCHPLGCHNSQERWQSIGLVAHHYSPPQIGRYESTLRLSRPSQIGLVSIGALLGPPFKGRGPWVPNPTGIPIPNPEKSMFWGLRNFPWVSWNPKRNPKLLGSRFFVLGSPLHNMAPRIRFKNGCLGCLEMTCPIALRPLVVSFILVKHRHH